MFPRRLAFAFNLDHFSSLTSSAPEALIVPGLVTQLGFNLLFGVTSDEIGVHLVFPYFAWSRF